MRTALDQRDSWQAPLAATAREIARALRRAGCEARLDGPEHVILVRQGVAMARLPLEGRVHPATLRALMRTLGMTPEDLTEYLADPR